MSEKEKKKAVVEGHQVVNDAIKKLLPVFFSRSPSGMVHVFATLTEAPDRAIWRRTGVDAGDVAAILSARQSSR